MRGRRSLSSITRGDASRASDFISLVWHGVEAGPDPAAAHARAARGRHRDLADGRVRDDGPFDPRRSDRPVRERRADVDFHPAAAPSPDRRERVGPGRRHRGDRLRRPRATTVRRSPAGTARADLRSSGRHRPRMARLFAFSDRRVVEHEYMGWLGPALGQRARPCDGARRPARGTRKGRDYLFDGALATALGPRDEAWLARRSPIPRGRSTSRRGGPTRPTPLSLLNQGSRSCGRGPLAPSGPRR